ncbi:MAG TPA: hypothetical protein VF984_03190 [Actinomycetota bacterium]
MRRLLPFALVALVALVAPACGGQTVDVAGASGSSTAPVSSSPSPSLVPSPKPSPTASPQIELPSDAPTTFDHAADAEQVPARDLVPSQAQVVSAWRLDPPAVPLSQIGLVWTRGADPFSAEHGFVLWQRFPQDPPWRVVFGFSDDVAAGVLGVRVETGDLTGDGVPDALTFEDLGGSGACGIWRVVAPAIGSASQLYRTKTCDTDIRISSGDLVIRESVYEPGDAHCCPSRYRTTTLEWDRNTWQVVDQVIEPA